MIGFVKAKFNFLAAFCVVAFFFCMVAILTAQYMYRKIKKYNTLIFSHRNDKYLFALLVLCTVGLAAVVSVYWPHGPRALPQPDKKKFEIEGSDALNSFYDLHQDRDIGLGTVSDDGWWSFDRIQLF